MSVALERAWAWLLPECDEACSPRRHDPHRHYQQGYQAGLAAAEAREREHGAIVVSGVLEVRVGRAEVAVEGRPVSVTPTEWRILRMLALDPGRLVESEALVGEVWGDDYWRSCRPAALHALRLNVLRLRNRLGPAAGLVVTLPGLGVRLEVVPPGAAPPPRARTSELGPTRACVTCGDLRPHHARGRCRSCYRRMVRARGGLS
jgi:hypothetical protein